MLVGPYRSRTGPQTTAMLGEELEEIGDGKGSSAATHEQR
jgi:hypothetical protein